MLTTYCATCSKFIKALLISESMDETHIGGVCEGCRDKLKVNLDHARKLLHDTHKRESSEWH